MSIFSDYRDHVGASAERWFKSTIFLSPNMLVGMDCLEPGQAQPTHQHAGRDKMYFVVEGEGEFTVGVETRRLGPGGLAWAPADSPHGVANVGAGRLTMLIAMAPEPK
ncbi:cupin domain-containing protein [Chloroflexales bacterium ZM16-3]|nr:cupin domain-containing protein [Chloroflexales bacterium ZM16-3]